jgi:hypothetical protein
MTVLTEPPVWIEPVPETETTGIPPVIKETKTTTVETEPKPEPELDPEPEPEPELTRAQELEYLLENASKEELLELLDNLTDEDAEVMLEIDFINRFEERFPEDCGVPISPVSCEPPPDVPFDNPPDMPPNTDIYDEQTDIAYQPCNFTS